MELHRFSAADDYGHLIIEIDGPSTMLGIQKDEGTVWIPIDANQREWIGVLFMRASDPNESRERE